LPTKEQVDAARLENLRQVLFEIMRYGNPQQRKEAQRRLKQLR